MFKGVSHRVDFDSHGTTTKLVRALSLRMCQKKKSNNKNDKSKETGTEKHSVFMIVAYGLPGSRAARRKTPASAHRGRPQVVQSSPLGVCFLRWRRRRIGTITP